MAKMIFVNLPVTDLERSTSFYEALGAEKNPQFSDATASCIVFSETIYAMLLTHEKFSFFSPRPIADARQSAQVLLCLTVESRADVDATIERAVAAGAGADPTPLQDHGFMYGRSFEDPDGHIWEITWMDVEAAQKAMAGAGETVGA